VKVSQQTLLSHLIELMNQHIVILAYILILEVLWTIDVLKLDLQLYGYQGYKLAIFIAGLEPRY
jgi:hypothetical protein